MIIRREVQLLKPILAARQSRESGGRREFDRLPSNGKTIVLPTNMQRWEWALLEARDSLSLPRVAVSCILPRPTFEVKLTSTYTRTFSHGATGMRQIEHFECVPSNAVVTWEWVLASALPPHAEIGDKQLEPPEPEQFDSMLRFIGEMLGMSEWGNHYGFGRFKVLQ